MKLDRKELVETLETEIQEEYVDSIKTKVKDLMKEIRMTEILLKKQKEKLEKYLSGELVITDEDILYE